MTDKPSWFAHESAYVDDGAQLGEGTKVWHFGHVMSGAKIGRKCIFGQNAHVAGDTVIGDNVKVQNNVSIYTGCVIEDDVFCGPSMVFTNVVNPRSEIVRRDEYRRTLVRRGASIGANATVVCGIEIGQYAFIAAGAVVARDVRPYALMIGVPARHHAWACRCGATLPKSGSSGERTLVCDECGNEYREADDSLTPLNEIQDQDRFHG
jgi:UDP-2-acetamido-3-amino-2,3-dideoxy-glucuronate N-acetyltransferase